MSKRGRPKKSLSFLERVRNGAEDILPWLIGGVAVAGVGGYAATRGSSSNSVADDDPLAGLDLSDEGGVSSTSSRTRQDANPFTGDNFTSQVNQIPLEDGPEAHITNPGRTSSNTQVRGNSRSRSSHSSSTVRRPSGGRYDFFVQGSGAPSEVVNTPENFRISDSEISNFQNRLIVWFNNNMNEKAYYGFPRMEFGHGINRDDFIDGQLGPATRALFYRYSLAHNLPIKVPLITLDDIRYVTLNT